MREDIAGNAKIAIRGNIDQAVGMQQNLPSSAPPTKSDASKSLVNPEPSTKSVERLFPFVLKSRALLVGRDTLWRSRSKLHFVLITSDISPNSRAEILSDFSHYPIVQKYTSAELNAFFGITGAKVVGFAKSGLAQSIYAELKSSRINHPERSKRP